MTCIFDPRLLENLSLTVNTNKKYFVIFQPNTWHVKQVFDNLENAITNGYKDTMENYYDCCQGENSLGLDQYSTMNEKYIGHNYSYRKGFIQNISGWQLLALLSNAKNKNQIIQKIKF